MNGTSRKFFVIALGVLLAVSAYPVIMGMKIVARQLLQGGVAPEDYARYVVPYTAICLAVLATAALYPAISRLKRLALPVATLMALGLFVGIELYMESITINSGGPKPAVQWQLALCISTPDAVKAFQGEYQDAFKIHYFLVAFVIISLAVSVFYGFVSVFSRKTGEGRVPLYMQLAACALLLALCVTANFTGFFRGVSLYQPPVSAILTGLFFVVLGSAAGIWVGSFLTGKGRMLSVWLPALVASAVCAVMYYGEYRLLGGALYRFGESFLFREVPGAVLAPVDVLVILLAGTVTGVIMGRVGRAHARAAALPPETPAGRGPAPV